MTLDASARPTASPIVRVLNEEVRHYHRWCTPSTLVDQERIEDFYASDVSISAGFFGTLVDHTGVFGEAERFAAAAQGADRRCSPCTGRPARNFVVLRMLALERPDALILVARNCHHSTINAIKALAWGGHLHFHPELPPSAIDAGADVAVQSTHKLAGGLQQTGLIHWREGRVDSELMEEAFREYVTTSPSYHLLASADAAVRSLAATGRDALGACIGRTRAFKALLRERLPRLRHLDEPAWVGSTTRTSPGATRSRRRSR
jgi:arginine/lysine/ornithine decarboxylase